jgi:hypothetical protein
VTTTNFYLTDTIEGEITKGTFDGYARCFEVRFNKNKMSEVIISCKVGFWKTSEKCLMPDGIWAWFITDSHSQTKMKAPEGIYSAYRDSKNKIAISFHPSS